MTADGIIRVLGEVMVDTVVVLEAPVQMDTDTPASIEDYDGGSAANLASWLAEVGTSVELIACVGDDAPGQRAIDALARQGVGLRVRRSSGLATGRCVVLVGPDGERTMLPDPGANADLRAQDLGAQAWLAADHLHVSGYTLMRPGARDAARTALESARASGLSISIDASSAEPLRQMAGGLLPWCAPGDVLFANADEAEVLTGERDPHDAAAALSRSGLVAVVKAGSRGAYLAQHASVVHAPAVDARIRDTTGAGDAFAAGYLAAWRSGADEPAALVAATRLAALAVGRPGGRP